ncbi:hypothetical protein BRADI_5g22223v3 [Brachypodium distachyon]|uniref:Uncharacterized protein n=1 Tax=Brachypodium distachyon TaxID=15368 RepID=A0A2K2CIL8_BRADI|nr:hypothetical protein BRADI_5g22223v3 [Brachypodium distachyon]
MNCSPQVYMSDTALRRDGQHSTYEPRYVRAVSTAGLGLLETSPRLVIGSRILIEFVRGRRRPTCDGEGGHGTTDRSTYQNHRQTDD